MEDDQHDSSAESSQSSHYSRVSIGLCDLRMDRDSEVARDFDEMQRIREQRVGDLIARRHVLEDEMRRVNTQLRAEEDRMTLSQLQSLEDRITTRVEMKIAAFFDRIAASFEAQRAMVFQGLRTMGVNGERRGYELVPSATKTGQLPIDDKKEGKEIITLAKPEEEGTIGRLRATEVANETPDEDWFCVLCDVSLTSKESYDEHCRKVIHDTVETGSCSPKKRKAVDLYDEEAMKKNPKSAKLGDVAVVVVGGGGGLKTGQRSETTPAEPIEDACQAVEHNDSSQTSKDENGNVNLWCTVCCARMNSIAVMESHIKGKKHRKRAAEVEVEVEVDDPVSNGDA